MKYSMFFLGCFLLGLSVLGDAYPIAGLLPDQRPEGAPVIKEMIHQDQLRRYLVHGIENPIPESIQKWMKDQGGWFTPFSHPGMLGRYDLRGWHKNNKSNE